MSKNTIVNESSRIDLEKKIGLSGQKAWVKMYLKLSTNCSSKKITMKSNNNDQQ
jgi:hypothetical protein